MALRDLRHQCGRVAVLVVELHQQIAMVHLAIDHAFAGLQFDLRDLRQRNERAVARRQHKIPDRLRTVARIGRKAHRHIVVAFADEDLADGAAADPGADQIGDVRNIDAVARRRFAIDLDRDLRQRRVLVDGRIGDAGNGMHQGDDVLADAAQLVEIVAEHLDGERAVRIEHLVEHAVDDRLAECDLEARQLRRASPSCGGSGPAWSRRPARCCRG